MNAPRGGGSLRTHTVTLQQSYYLYNIPSGITFHGVQRQTFLDALYKDCSGSAPTPDNAAFNHDDPTLSNWHVVELENFDENFVPFSSPSDDGVANSVVAQECRLLFTKIVDSHPTRENYDDGERRDSGRWDAFPIFRACDSTSADCTPAAAGTEVTLTTGRVYTRYNDTVTDCGVETPSPVSAFIGEESFPEVEIAANSSTVLAGELAVLELNPGSDNRSSQYTDGNWYIDLSSVRHQVALDSVLSQVIIDGAEPIRADQNIEGQSCDIVDESDIDSLIVFHPPDSDACLSGDDLACLAWWQVAPACKPPNGYFRPKSGGSTNELKQYFKFRLSLQILSTVPAGTELDFLGQVRRDDGDGPSPNLGANNAVSTSRWPASRYEDIATIEVLPAPAVQVNKTGPVTWPANEEMYYTIDVTNVGNVPLFGLYVVDRLPRTDVSGTSFNPTYRRVYVSAGFPTGAALVEYSTDSGCYANSLSSSWTRVGTAMEATSLPGYAEQTDADVDPSAVCIRVRLTPGASIAARTQFFIGLGVDVTAAADGDTLVNEASIGADPSLGPAGDVVELPEVQTRAVTTTIDGAGAVQVSKSFSIDRTRAGYIRWILRYSNASGVPVSNVTVTDTIPAELIYEGLATPLDDGESCPAGSDCPAQDTEADGSGGRVVFLIDSLAPFDGTVGSGDDEGTVEIYTRVKEGVAAGTLIENCVEAEATGAIGQPSTCTGITTIDFAVSKSITGDPPQVVVGQEIEYVIVATNNSGSTQYVTVFDDLPAATTYVAGSLRIDGSVAPDLFIGEDGNLYYEHPTAIASGGSLEVRLRVEVSGVPGGGELSNVAIGSGCTNPFDEATCSPASASATVLVTVPADDRDGDGVPDDVDDDPDNPFVCRDVDGDSCDDCSQTGADGSGGDTGKDGPDTDGEGA